MEQKPIRNVILMDKSLHTMDATKERIERIASLVEEKGQDKERFLELLQRILERGSSEEIGAFLRVLSDEKSLQAFYTLISLSEAREEEEVEERSSAFQEKLRSRSDSSEADIKAGRTLSIDEVDRRKEELIRKHYEG